MYHNGTVFFQPKNRVALRSRSQLAPPPRCSRILRGPNSAWDESPDGRDLDAAVQDRARRQLPTHSATQGRSRGRVRIARRLAQLVYRMQRHGQDYLDIGAQAYKALFASKGLASFKETARGLGYTSSRPEIRRACRPRFRSAAQLPARPRVFQHRDASTAYAQHIAAGDIPGGSADWNRGSHL